MNSKAWKVSASIILTLRSPILREPTKNVLNKLSTDDNHALQSASENDLDLLTVRRGGSDRHLPGIHVFPGGHLDQADTSPVWIELFKSFGYRNSNFSTLTQGGGIDHMPDYKDVTNDSSLPGWMSLRLCAIRETFEETGILLCRNSSSLPFASFTILNELPAWQSRVKADPRQMLALCETVGCVPDLWGLHLWSNWLTPTQQKVRHNSVFFLAVLHSMPPFSLDKSEMDEIKCWRAQELLRNTSSGAVRLANPQLYEASCLSTFKTAQSLASFAAERSLQGCPRTMPVQEKVKGGVLCILPGDSAYPQNIDYETPCPMIKREESFEELQEQIKINDGTLHRIEILDGSPCQRIITHNFTPLYGCVSPRSF